MAPQLEVERSKPCGQFFSSEQRFLEKHMDKETCKLEIYLCSGVKHVYARNDTAFQCVFSCIYLLEWHMQLDVNILSDICISMHRSE